MRALATIASAITMAIAALPPALAGPALLFDAKSGQVLYSEDADDNWYPSISNQNHDGLCRVRGRQNRQVDA